MIHLLKSKSRVGIAEKPRKKFSAFMPNPNGEDEKTVNLNAAEGLDFSFSQKQPQGKSKINPIQIDVVPKE
jgi:hypothetical protein